jgi:hypothetical protein
MVSCAVRKAVGVEAVAEVGEALDVDGRCLTLSLLLKNGDHLGAWPPWRSGPTSQSFGGVVQTIASDGVCGAFAVVARDARCRPPGVTVVTGAKTVGERRGEGVRRICFGS